MSLALASFLGLSVGLLVYALRRRILAKYHSDVLWLQHTMWLFKPDVESKGRTVGLYYAGVIAVSIAIWLIFLSPIFVAVWLVLTQVVPKMWAKVAWNKRRDTINEQLPAAVRQLGSSVGSGMSIAQAVERLATRAQHPVRMEFYVISNYWKLGADFGTSIRDAKRRLDLPSFNLFASALLVNQSMGGNLTGTLNRLAHSLEEIDRMQREVRAATAEGRTNIKVLAVAPAIILSIVAFMDAEAVGMLFTKPVGQAILALCLGLTVAGTWWAWQIVESDV